jgi:hypothetical protein
MRIKTSVVGDERCRNHRILNIGSFWEQLEYQVDDQVEEQVRTHLEDHVWERTDLGQFSWESEYD